MYRKSGIFVVSDSITSPNIKHVKLVHIINDSAVKGHFQVRKFQHQTLSYEIFVTRNYGIS